MDEKKPDPVARWANKLAGDKLAMDKVGDGDRGKLLELCILLAERFPDVTCRHHRYHTRKDVCEAAIDLGIDLLTIRSGSRYKRGKPLIGRGLLEAWTVVLAARFGSAVGTNAWFEQRRRDIKTKMAKDGVSLAALYARPAEGRTDELDGGQV